MRTFLTLACLILQAAPLAAEVSLGRPASCNLVATVQDDHCAVSNYYTCSGAGPVAFWKEVSLGNGAVEVHTLDANHGTIEIVMPGGTQIKSQNTGDHPRVAVTAGSAESAARATVTSGEYSQSATMVTKYNYKDETRELGRETFNRLTYSSDLNFPESGSTLRASGTVLFSDRLDLMVLETDVSDGQGGPARTIKLKSFALEGQNGFGSTRPRYGCN